MFKWFLNKKGQSTAEYAILIGLVVATVIAMQTYFKQGLQGRVRDAVDHVGAGGDVGGTTLTFTGDQFDPQYLTSNFDVTRSTGETETVSIGGGVTTDVTDDTSDRTGEQTISYSGQ